MARVTVSEQALEVLSQPSSPRLYVSGYAVEVLHTIQTISPSVITGAGVSQYAVEVLHNGEPNVIVDQYCLEVLMSVNVTEASGVGGTHSWMVIQ